MGFYTEYTTRWLDRRYAEIDADGRYFAHMPIYGLHHPCGEGNHLVRYARLFQVLRELNHLEFGSCLDVGGGEGFIMHAVRELFGADVVSADLSAEACQRAYDLFQIDGVAIDSARLPFADDSFDVVLCCEVVEHVEHGIECLLELARVARHAVVFTTEELELDRSAIERELFRRCGYPHHERNFFHPDDLKLLFGDGITMRSQFRDCVPHDATDVEAAAHWIREATAIDGLHEEGRGVVMTFTSDPAVRRTTPRVSEEQILDGMLRRTSLPDAPLSIATRANAEPRVLARCVCPLTREPLESDGDTLVSPGGQRYAVVNGVPVLRDLTAADPTEAELEARLACGGSDAARTDAILALRRKLELPFDRDKLSWQFADVEDRRGWMPAESMEERGGFSFMATDADPWLASPGLDLDAAEVRTLAIRMRTFNPDFPVEGGEGQVFFMTDDDTTLSEDRSFRFPVRNKDEVTEYRLDLASQPEWPDSGSIRFLRIDPANGPCAIDLESVWIET